MEHIMLMERTMQSLKVLLAASGFVTYFVGMIGISALTTSVVHSAFSARAVPMAVTLE
jgi:uncharacterized membrane protein